MATTTWHETDAFWKDLKTAIFSERRWTDAPEEARLMVERLGLETGARVLDLPCGPGRHSIELARLGMNVTGVDRTPEYLAEALERAAKRGVTAAFEHGDMRSFRREEGFNAVINMFTSFGYFDQPGEDAQTLTNFHANLVPGGRVLLEMMSKESVAANFQPRAWHELDDGSLLLEDREVIDAWQAIRTKWIVVKKDGTRVEHELNLRCYSAGELIALAESVGFVDVQAFGTLTGEPYDHTAQRLVVVGRKG